jgi:orotidine-5'-phosphate decarboxylase
MAPPVPILALDVPSAGAAWALLDQVGSAARFVKVGLQLYLAEGPTLVRALRAEGRAVFLDLKLHDIPNTVAGAVASAAELEVELLTVHASGGAAMLRAAAAAAQGSPLRLLGVTVLTSHDQHSLAEAWGRGALQVRDEAARLARLASDNGVHAVVAAVDDLPALRAAAGPELKVLCPGIRFAGDAAGDQSRVATPAQAARLGADWVVLGRSVTAAADPAAAWRRAVDELSANP